MDMKRLMLAAALALVAIAPASAGDWYCLGTVKVEKEWTTIKDTSCLASARFCRPLVTPPLRPD